MSNRFRSTWLDSEDQLLADVVGRLGAKNWSLIAKYVPGRTGKQCRERFKNHLDPTLRKGPFTPAEDAKLIQLIEEHGPKWAYIAQFLTGRTDNAIKNRYNSSLRRAHLEGRLDSNPDDTLDASEGQPSDNEDDDDDDDSVVPPTPPDSPKHPLTDTDHSDEDDDGDDDNDGDDDQPRRPSNLPHRRARNKKRVFSPDEWDATTTTAAMNKRARCTPATKHHIGKTNNNNSGNHHYHSRSKAAAKASNNSNNSKNNNGVTHPPPNTPQLEFSAAVALCELRDMPSLKVF